jgi:hypothetical protein
MTPNRRVTWQATSDDGYLLNKRRPMANALPGPWSVSAGAAIEGVGLQSTANQFAAISVLSIAHPRGKKAQP